MNDIRTPAKLHRGPILNAQSLITEGVNDLAVLLNKVESGIPIAEVSKEYVRILDTLLGVVDHEKNVKLLARMRRLSAILEKPGESLEKKRALLSELPRVKADLSQVDARVVTPPNGMQDSVQEGMADDGLLTGETIALKVVQMQNLNRLLSDEIDQTTTENQTAFGQNKILKEKLDSVLKLHDETKENLRVLQNKVASTQVEYNKVLLESQFLMNEKTRILQQIEAESQLLATLSKRYELLKRNYDFSKGESDVTQDLLEHLEVMLGNVHDQQKVLMDKAGSSEKSFNALLDELNSSIKKGKMLYYFKQEDLRKGGA